MNEQKVTYWIHKIIPLLWLAAALYTVFRVWGNPTYNGLACIMLMYLIYLAFVIINKVNHCIKAWNKTSWVLKRIDDRTKGDNEETDIKDLPDTEVIDYSK